MKKHFTVTENFNTGEYLVLDGAKTTALPKKWDKTTVLKKEELNQLEEL
jgi:hypothetical protein